MKPKRSNPTCKMSMVTLFIALLTACGKINAVSIGPCIKPSLSVAFPTYATVQPGKNPEKVLPGGDWQVEATIPNGVPNLIHSFTIRRNKEIWMSISNNVDGLVYKYRIDTHEWSSYSSIDGKPIVPEALVLSPDDTLWGVGLSGRKLNQVTSNIYPILSRYNEELDRFQFVKDPEEKVKIFSTPRYPPMVSVDHTGTIWMILNKGSRTPAGLYSYDPGNDELTSQLSNFDLSGHASLAIAPNNDVWIFDPTIDPKLIRYHPYLGKYDDSFINLTDWNIKNWYGGVLYFDRLGKLWSGIDGWIDFTNPETPVWYEIIRSPVFITDYYDGGDQFVWAHPNNIYQSSNSWYWFSLPNNGIVRLDVSTNEWCRFTTEYSPVIEDNQKNIRIIVDGKIYMINLGGTSTYP